MLESCKSLISWFQADAGEGGEGGEGGAQEEISMGDFKVSERFAR